MGTKNWGGTGPGEHSHSEPALGANPRTAGWVGCLLLLWVHGREAEARVALNTTEERQFGQK